MCSTLVGNKDGTTSLYRLPPALPLAFAGSEGVEFVRTATCEELAVVGRLAVLERTGGESSLPPGWYLVRAKAEPAVEGWAWGGTLPEDLLKGLPIVEIAPLHPGGQPSLQFGQPYYTGKPGDRCLGSPVAAVGIRNDGTGTSSRTVLVLYNFPAGRDFPAREERTTFHLVRGLEPGEQVIVGAGGGGTRLVLYPDDEGRASVGSGEVVVPYSNLICVN